MERVEVLLKLRDTGEFPDGFSESHPRQSQLISWMMNRDPEQRPTTAELMR